MKIILKPIIKLIFAIILICLDIFQYLGYTLIIFLWDFKIKTWLMYKQNPDIFIITDSDKNIIQTFKKYYNLNL